MKKKDFDTDELLKKLFEPKPVKVKETLEELFLDRLNSLDIPKTTALKIMGMTTRTLNGILTGEQKVLDYTQLIKLSNFLGLSIEKVAKLYIEKLQEVHQLVKDIHKTSQMVDFINENFNLAELRKIGLIKSLTDYPDIINSICNYFGLKEIFDYEAPRLNIAFSAGKKAKKNCSTENWMFLAEQTCLELRNTNDYSRESLIDYFPQIRWYCMDVDKGLPTVINHLFHMGITVVFIPTFPSLHIRGATFCINQKPCIAITDYVGFYPTLWFTLIHELHHVLFDWDEILVSNYHVSQTEEGLLDSNSRNEKEADDFARKYLFSVEKTKDVNQFINNHQMVKQYSISNHVDASFAYVFSAFDTHKTNKYAWGRAKKRNPNMKKLKSKLEHNFNSEVKFEEHIKMLRKNTYN